MMKKFCLNLICLLLICFASCAPDPIEEIRKHKTHLEYLSQYMMEFPNFRPFLSETYKRYENEWKTVVSNQKYSKRERSTQMAKTNDSLSGDEVYMGLSTFSPKFLLIRSKLQDIQKNKQQLKSFNSENKKKVRLVYTNWKKSGSLLKTSKPKNYASAVEVIHKANRLLRLANQNLNFLEQELHKKTPKESGNGNR